jgi:hypothetical protein
MTVRPAEVEREEVATIQVGTVGGERIDVSWGIKLP